MNFKSLSVAAAVALLGSTAAFAQEVAPPFDTTTASVHAQPAGAPEARLVTIGEATVEAASSVSKLSRDEVVAETRDARPLGLLSGGELPEFAATPARAAL